MQNTINVVQQVIDSGGALEWMDVYITSWADCLVKFKIGGMIFDSHVGGYGQVTDPSGNGDWFTENRSGQSMDVLLVTLRYAVTGSQTEGWAIYANEDIEIDGVSYAKGTQLGTKLTSWHKKVYPKGKTPTDLQKQPSASVTPKAVYVFSDVWHSTHIQAIIDGSALEVRKGHDGDPFAAHSYSDNYIEYTRNSLWGSIVLSAKNSSCKYKLISYASGDATAPSLDLFTDIPTGTTRSLAKGRQLVFVYDAATDDSALPKAIYNCSMPYDNTVVTALADGTTRSHTKNYVSGQAWSLQMYIDKYVQFNRLDQYGNFWFIPMNDECTYKIINFTASQKSPVGLDWDRAERFWYTPELNKVTSMPKGNTLVFVW